jgi:hypothetical protein
MFVGDASGDRLTAAMTAVMRQSLKDIAKPKENTGKQKKGKKPTGTRKTVGDTA